MLEVIFKLIPTVLIAGLNLRIMMVYRKTCERRRKMILTRASYIKDEDPRKFAEERRLFLLLGKRNHAMTYRCFSVNKIILSLFLYFRKYIYFVLSLCIAHGHITYDNCLRSIADIFIPSNCSSFHKLYMATVTLCQLNCDLVYLIVR